MQQGHHLELLQHVCTYAEALAGCSRDRNDDIDGFAESGKGKQTLLDGIYHVVQRRARASAFLCEVITVYRFSCKLSYLPLAPASCAFVSVSTASACLLELVGFCFFLRATRRSVRCGHLQLLATANLQRSGAAFTGRGKAFHFRCITKRSKLEAWIRMDGLAMACLVCRVIWSTSPSTLNAATAS